MAITTISKTFSNVASPIINAVQSVLPIVCGVPESALSGISDRYILELTADLGGNVLGFGTGKHEFTVHAYLQDKIVLTSQSNWEGIVQSMPGVGELIKGVDTVSQAALGRTAISTVSTQRKWTGSEPIGLIFKLKFEAVNDVYREVLLPCMGLQSLTLPRGGVMNTVGLIPPGPSPFTLTQSGKTEFETRGENITINIGNFISFRSVIVRNVRVTYENRMSDVGPIGAEVELTVETWRMLTREELQAAYKEQMSTTTTGTLGQGNK